MNIFEALEQLSEGLSLPLDQLVDADWIVLLAVEWRCRPRSELATAERVYASWRRAAIDAGRAAQVRAMGRIVYPS